MGGYNTCTASRRWVDGSTSEIVPLCKKQAFLVDTTTSWGEPSIGPNKAGATSFSFQNPVSGQREHEHEHVGECLLYRVL